MRQRGFSFLEVILALALVGLVASALLMALSQGRRTQTLTREWAQDEIRATELLMDSLNRWEQLRTEVARRAQLRQNGEDPRLGPWEWSIEPQGLAPGRLVDLYKVRLRWNAQGKQREVETDAVLRILP